MPGTTLVLSDPSPAASVATFGYHSELVAPEKLKSNATLTVPDLQLPSQTPHPPTNQAVANDVEETTWGSHFWVTLVDPQTQTSFFACPATGQVSWDPPVGNFVLPPSAEGEWWELSDESRGGIAYYYQTKTGETVWEKPDGFVIPLAIIQHTALGRRLSQTKFGQSNQETGQAAVATPDRSTFRRSLSYNGHDLPRISTTGPPNEIGNSTHHPSRRTDPPPGPGVLKNNHSPMKRSASHDHPHHQNGSVRFHPHTHSQHLPPIPGSPAITDVPSPSTSSSRKSSLANGDPSPKPPSPNGKANATGTTPANADAILRPRSRSSPYVQRSSPPQQQSLSAAAELLTCSENYSVSDSGHSSTRERSPSGTDDSHHTNPIPMHDDSGPPDTPTRERPRRSERPPTSPTRPVPAAPARNVLRRTSVPKVALKEISGPILNQEATLNLSPIKNRVNGKPIPVQPHPRLNGTPTATSISHGTYPILPQALAMDIQQFSESDYAKRYFSTHRTGFIFRRKVPVAQLMTWQKTPLTSPLLTLHRSLHKDAVKIFKVIQRIMGDRERDRSVGVRIYNEHYGSIMGNGSTTSLVGSVVSILEEERWLLGEGLTHGELRDEIYCQLMKQLCGNPIPENAFKGMQLFCVLLITFPPSKNFETYLQSYLQQKTTQHEGRVDVMAKYCLRRLSVITKKGPRGKPPTVAEIETASDAAFNPSTFGESLDAIIRLQERNYPQQMVPIILPFLADGILALGGTKSEGIFRVPGDGDSVSELKLRIDRGYYTLNGVDDPYVLASLLKLWLRELCDPLVPDEMYNECIANSSDPEACVRIVERLPTINRRVVLFVISFLQLFLEEKVQVVTKMTPANLALVMAPNLLRCNSESMTVVFTNAQYEQIFVYNLLLYLNCAQIDSMYLPTHGLGAVPSLSPPRTSKSRPRRPNH